MKQVIKNTWVPIKEYECFVQVDSHGALWSITMDGSGTEFTEIGEVTSPQSQAFLNLVNEKLGTDYRVEQFDRRYKKIAF